MNAQAPLPPNDADRRTERAVQAYLRGDLAEAARLCESALSSQPQHVEALNLLGAVTMQRGDLTAAAALFGSAVALSPGHAPAHFNLGFLYERLGRLAEAAASYRRCAELWPVNVDAHLGLGNVQQAIGQLDEALLSYQRAIRVQPDCVEAFNNLGNALRRLQRLDESLVAFDRTVALKPDYASAWSNRAETLRRLDRLPEAAESCEQAIRLKPDFAAALNNLGNVRRAQGKFDEALESFRRAVEAQPDLAEAYCNQGAVLESLYRYEEALDLYRRAAVARPDHVKTLLLSGCLLQNLRRDDEALVAYAKAAELAPDDPDVAWNRALFHLSRGDFARGWPLFEVRWQRDEFQPERRAFPAPLWLGREEVAGQTILLYGEQGLGDAVQFSRFAPEVAVQGARVILEVPRTLVGLLSSLDAAVHVIARGDPLPPVDRVCPLMSLPLALGVSVDSIPAADRYLSVDAQRRAEWERRLGSKARPRVGLVWSGRRDHGNDRERSIGLEALLPLLGEHCEFHAIQKEIRPSDRDALARALALKTWEAELGDFSDAAALVAAMDVVISVDTSIAHLAGALGKPVWILLPYFSEYRWLLERDDSPWYPTARLFRQKRPGDWAGLLEDVRQQLAGLSSPV